jgi:hypothetical protein
MAAAASAAAQPYLTGPFASTTALNDPTCNLPDPTTPSALCEPIGTTPDAATCAADCLAAANCTSYTWHDQTQGDYANVCVFRTDGAWQPLTNAPGHTAGQKITATRPVWPITNGFDGLLPVAWFGANTSGLDSAATLALISQHRVGG